MEQIIRATNVKREINIVNVNKFEGLTVQLFMKNMHTTTHINCAVNYTYDKRKLVI